MKRRTFLGLTLGSLGLPVLAKAGGSRLYGKPGSISGPTDVAASDQLKLSLSKANIPVETWPDLTQFANLWNRILSDKSERQRFNANPEFYLMENGVPTAIMDSGDGNIELLRLVASDNFLADAARGDYTQVLGKMQQRGIIKELNSSKLRNRLIEIFSADSERFKKELSGLNQQLMVQDAEMVFENDEELLYIYNEMARRTNDIHTEVIGLVAVVVVLVALATIYVSVGAIATVGITAGFSVVVAATVGVVASSQEQKIAANAGRIGRLASLDPETFRKYETLVRAARISGKKDLEVESLKALVSEEIDAFISAAEHLGMIETPISSNANLMTAIHHFGHRSCGLVA